MHSTRIVGLPRKQFLQTMQALFGSFDDVDQPLALNTVEQQSSPTSAGLPTTELQSRLHKFSQPLAEKSSSASSNDIAQPLVSNANDYDEADLASNEGLVMKK